MCCWSSPHWRQSAAQNAAQQAHASTGTSWQEATKAPDEQGLMRNCATPDVVVPEVKVAGTGFERSPYPPGNSPIATTGAAKSGALSAANQVVDAELNEVTSTCSLLSADLRHAILAIVRAGRSGGRGMHRCARSRIGAAISQPAPPAAGAVRLVTRRRGSLSIGGVWIR